MRPSSFTFIQPTIELLPTKQQRTSAHRHGSDNMRYSYATFGSKSSDQSLESISMFALSRRIVAGSATDFIYSCNRHHICKVWDVMLRFLLLTPMMMVAKFMTIFKLECCFFVREKKEGNGPNKIIPKTKRNRHTPSFPLYSPSITKQQLHQQLIY